MRIKITIVIIVLLFTGLLAIQLFFIIKTWDHTSNRLEQELENVLSGVYSRAENDSLFTELLGNVILMGDEHSIEALNEQLVALKTSETFESDDISFEIYANTFTGDSNDFLLQNVGYNKEQFASLKKHHFCLTCILENNYDDRENYVELGAVINHPVKLQLAALWLPISLSFLFLLILSIFSIVILKKWAAATQLNIQKNGFINNLSHELKTPVFSIQLFSQLIIEKSSDQALSEYGKRIKMETSHLEKQIHRILESTGLESGHLIRFEEIELSSFLSEMSPTIALLCDQTATRFHLNLPTSTELFIQADSVHLKNVINALVDNAIKYRSENPVLTIDLEVKENRVIILFADNGIGIPDSEKRRVLEKFHRLNMNDTNTVAGFGIGLYYANEATKQMNGLLSIEDNRPKGIIVSLQFNLSRS